MDSITFTISLKDLDACNSDFGQLVDAIQAFINILHHASPDYVEAGNILQKQLDEQVKRYGEETDPKVSMQWYLDNIAPIVIDGSDPNLNALYCNLRKNIGEAMGPISYAAYQLAEYLKEQNFTGGDKWVWDFVKYYEANWKF